MWEALSFFSPGTWGHRKSSETAAVPVWLLLQKAVVGIEDDVTGHVSLTRDCVYSKLLKGCLGLRTDAAKTYN